MGQVAEVKGYLVVTKIRFRITEPNEDKAEEFVQECQDELENVFRKHMDNEREFVQIEDVTAIRDATRPSPEGETPKAS